MISSLLLHNASDVGPTGPFVGQKFCDKNKKDNLNVMVTHKKILEI